MTASMPKKLNALPGLKFDTSYARLPDGFFTISQRRKITEPKLQRLNKKLAATLGLDLKNLEKEAVALALSGALLDEDASLLSMNYAGHQFGRFNPYMGDGRAALIGEVVDQNGKRQDIQLKGSGPTAYSRRGDGLAALGPVIREYVVSAGMHGLGIPTTQSLAIVSTGEKLLRETILNGAVLTRVAGSHIRIGTFQYFAARNDIENLKLLADYTINRHYPELLDHENPVLGLLERVIEVQAYLVAKWMSVGFIHGVMNTDNMTISGETIDYGPCAFMDHYEHNKTYSSIDVDGRYAYSEQPNIASWNLSRFAEALLVLIDNDEKIAIEKAKCALDVYAPCFIGHWRDQMMQKFGLIKHNADDETLIRRFLTLMQKHHVDFTGVFRELSHAAVSDQAREGLKAQFNSDPVFDEWLRGWQKRLAVDDINKAEIAKQMLKVNPVYIPRNHLVEAAIKAAESDGDFSVMDRLIEAVENPYCEKSGFEDLAAPPQPEEEVHQTFCGT